MFWDLWTSSGAPISMRYPARQVAIEQLYPEWLLHTRHRHRHDGEVLFDNQKDSPALMGNHLHRKEVQDALRTGTGLGLAIVKNIALQYGGSATASETPGVG